jgi:hypothetical protein
VFVQTHNEYGSWIKIRMENLPPAIIERINALLASEQKGDFCDLLVACARLGRVVQGHRLSFYRSRPECKIKYICG